MYLFLFTAYFYTNCISTIVVGLIENFMRIVTIIFLYNIMLFILIKKLYNHTIDN